MAFQQICLFYHLGKDILAQAEAQALSTRVKRACEYFRHLRLRLLYTCEPGFVEMKETEKGNLAKF